MMRRYIFKLYPTKEQGAQLQQFRRMMADLWNALKQRQEDTYRRTRGQKGVCHLEAKPGLTFFDMTNEITTLRLECPEWRDVPSVTAHRVAKHLVDSYGAFYRRLKAGEAPGYPRWQRREQSKGIPLGTMAKTGWCIKQRADNPRSWRLHFGVISKFRQPETWIHGRGALPGEPSDWRNADILWRDDHWWLSLCVEMEARRSMTGAQPIEVKFDLLDDFVRVNGIAETPEGLIRARLLEQRLDELRSRKDQIKRLRFEEDETTIAAMRLAAKIARVRKNALHVWSARIICRASEIMIIAPPLRGVVQTPRGDEKSWGANIDPVSALNRNTLAQAPGMAIQMLKYKAEEAGIRCSVTMDETPKIAVGGDLVAAGKQLRRARRELRRAS